jgi:hypothetical protein
MTNPHAVSYPKNEHTFKKCGVTLRAKFSKIRNGSVLESCEHDNECSASIKGRQVRSSPAERLSVCHNGLLYAESDTHDVFITVPKCCTLEYWKKVMLTYQQQ